MKLQAIDIDVILWLDHKPSSILELSDAKMEYGPLELLKSVRRLEDRGLLRRLSSGQWPRFKLSRRVKTDRQLHKDFVARRPEVLERDDYTCTLCQKSGNTVHHIDYNRANNLLDNLITLCRSCHGRTNGDREYWREVFTRRI